MNKKGDKIISVYWFVILFIVAAAIVYMVISFYGNPYDVREAEASALIDSVARCITEGPYLKESVLSGIFPEDFSEECSLNFETEDIYGGGSEGQYFVEVFVYDFNSKEEIFSASEGNENLRQNCGLEGKGFPVCLERKFYSLDNEGGQYEISILSIVRKTEKNVQ